MFDVDYPLSKLFLGVLEPYMYDWKHLMMKGLNSRCLMSMDGMQCDKRCIFDVGMKMERN